MLIQRPLGWRAPESLGRAPHTGSRVDASILDVLPREVRLAGVPAVYDQGSVGSCTAQALAAAVEILHARLGYAPERPDRVALYRRERDAIGLADEDSGAILADGLAALRCGYEPEREHPAAWGPAWLQPAPFRDEDIPRLVSNEPLAVDVATACWELAGGHPVVVGLAVTAAWQMLAGDTLPPPAGESIGGHAVVLTGYRRTAEASVEFRVHNSWGAGWGDNGEAWLPAAWLAIPWCGELHVARAVRRSMDGAA